MKLKLTAKDEPLSPELRIELRVLMLSLLAPLAYAEGNYEL
eukprot:SAG31_NODE_11609_length_1013_cov_4.615974_1_plen_40_part_10